MGNKLVFQLCMGSNLQSRKIVLYLLAKLTSKYNKVRQFRLVEMEEFMFERMCLLAFITYISNSKLCQSCVY